jgi:16S rRNA C1402 (ribose-2'-O) methylase RsmI
VVCVCSELTKLHERSYYGKIEEVYEKMVNDPSSEKGEYVVLINNEPNVDNSDNKISLEALIIDEIVKNNCSVKEAISLVTEKNKNVSKKDVYNASLNLKKLI